MVPFLLGQLPSSALASGAIFGGSLRLRTLCIQLLTRFVANRFIKSGRKPSIQLMCELRLQASHMDLSGSLPLVFRYLRQR